MAHDEGQRCLCVSEHRPSVLEYVEHHIIPSGLGGPDTPANRIWLCDNAHRSTHELMRLMFKMGRSLTDHELQDMYAVPVSRYAANLARIGYRLTLAQSG